MRAFALAAQRALRLVEQTVDRKVNKWAARLAPQKVDSMVVELVG